MILLSLHTDVYHPMRHRTITNYPSTSVSQ